MGDYTYGTLTIYSVPEWTEDDAERLALLEGIAAGPHADDPRVDSTSLKEDLDTLRDRRVLIVGHDGEGPWPQVLDDLDWGNHDPDDGLPMQFNQEEVRCGWVDADEDGLLGRLEAAGFAFVAHEDPKYEWLGTILMHHPDLGSFNGLSDSDGNVVLPDTHIDSIVKAAPVAALPQALHDATGKAWRDLFYGPPGS